mmetsp:Transcript_30517/g.46539  ORF Transcript_30517/g.46539 Transcript_30517/m.46539 type:complete len:372 (+) Transcript_30517:53-1168(+)
MQIGNRKWKRRLDLRLYLSLGGILFFAFYIYQGRNLEEYFSNPFQEPTSSLDLSSSPEVKALIDAAVAKALKDANQGPSSSSPSTPQKSFRDFGDKTQTDKTNGYSKLPLCLKDDKNCLYPGHENDRCKVWGHFYDTIYDRWLGPYSTGDFPMQFLEIGYYKGNGFEAYTKYIGDNKAAELHSMEISCIEEGPRAEGKWPWGNFAINHRWYKDLVRNERLHCGDASDYDFLKEIWETKMKRPGAPPLKVVIDDASHLYQHMATSLFFWFPRIEPGGILVVEDIQPRGETAKFRTHIVPQVMKDLHWCGGNGNNIMPDSLCFPTIQPFLFGIHCEMHICVFERNDKPAIEPSKEDSLTPPHAFDDIPQCLFK